MYVHQQKCLRKARCPEHTSPSWSSWSSSHPVPILADPLSLQCPLISGCLGFLKVMSLLWAMFIFIAWCLWCSWFHVVFSYACIFWSYVHLCSIFPSYCILEKMLSGYPGPSGIAQVLSCCCLISLMPNQKEIKQEVIDEDDGLGDEPPKAELTEEEARCSMRRKSLSVGCVQRLRGQRDRWTKSVKWFCLRHDKRNLLLNRKEGNDVEIQPTSIHQLSLMKVYQQEKNPWFFFRTFRQDPQGQEKGFSNEDSGFRIYNSQQAPSSVFVASTLAVSAGSLVGAVLKHLYAECILLATRLLQILRILNTTYVFG